MKIPYTPENSEIISNIANNLQDFLNSQAIDNKYFIGDSFKCSYSYNQKYLNYVIHIVFYNGTNSYALIYYFDCDNRILRSKFLGQNSIPPFYQGSFIYLNEALDRHFS